MSVAVKVRRKRPPKEIKIGHVTVKVKKKKLKNLYGQYIYATHDLELNNNLSPIEEKGTVLHECLHGIVRIYALQSNADITAEQEEKVVCTMETALMSLLRDNPKLVKYLCQKE